MRNTQQSISSKNNELIGHIPIVEHRKIMKTSELQSHEAMTFNKMINGARETRQNDCIYMKFKALGTKQLVYTWLSTPCGEVVARRLGRPLFMGWLEEDQNM